MRLELTDGRTIEGEVVKCKSCGADIIWGKTKNDRPCPYSVEHQDSHFRDCPNARQHSKKNATDANLFASVGWHRGAGGKYIHTDGREQWDRPKEKWEQQRGL